MVDEDAIWRQVFARVDRAEMRVDWLTPSGRRRSSPIYWTVVANAYLGKEKTIKTSDAETLERKAKAQLQQWAEEEARARVREATQEAKEAARSQADQDNADARDQIESLRNILHATLEVNDRIDWEKLLDYRSYPAFPFDVPAPGPPMLPPPQDSQTARSSGGSFLR